VQFTLRPYSQYLEGGVIKQAYVQSEHASVCSKNITPRTLMSWIARNVGSCNVYFFNFCNHQVWKFESGL